MMIFEVFRAAFTAALEDLFGLDMTPAGRDLDNDNIRDYFIQNGGNPLAAALAMGAKYQLSRIDQLRETARGNS